MMKCIFGKGVEGDDKRRCVLEAVKDFVDPKLIIFFSEERNFQEYAAMIHERFPKAVSIGCTAYRMWGSAGSEKGVLMALSVEDGIKCSAGVIENADNFAMSYTDNVKKCVEEVGDTSDTVCVEFTVPFKRYEEYALMTLNSVLLRKEIPVVGGSAGNAVNGTDYVDVGYVALNGKTYPNGCVFVLIHSYSGRIYMRRENIYEPLTGKELLTTKANSVTRTVMAYNKKPAADVYAEQLGVPRSEINKYFFHYPMGRQVGDEIFMTAIHEEGSNGSMKYLARIHEGTNMMVMKEGDYRRINAETIDLIKKETEEPSLVIAFQCTARTILFEENNYIDEYAKMLADAFPNYIGFSCNGEQQNTKHFNHTLTLVVFE